MLAGAAGFLHRPARFLGLLLLTGLRCSTMQRPREAIAIPTAEDRRAQALILAANMA